MVLGSKSLRKAKDKLLDSMSQTVTLKLVHGRDVYETTMPCFSSFGQLKEYAHSITGIPLQDTRLNFKGRDRLDHDTLAAAGVKQGARIFVGESEEYKASIAAQKEAQELAALQKEQQSLLGQTSNPSIRASPTVARPREQPQAQQPHNFAQWPTTAHSAAPPLKQQAAGPPGEAQQSMAAISNVAQQVDELETKVQALPAQTNSTKEAVKLSEVLTQKLLILDEVTVTPETRQLRKAQINRINNLCDQLEVIKSRPPAGGNSWTQF